MNHAPIILIVDDQEENRLAVKLALKKENYDFLEASNGIEALEILQKHHADVILIDAIMPEMDGFETTKQLRSFAKTERTPVLMITALNEKSDRIHALEAGVNDFISKPFDKHVLIARCRSYVNMVQLNEKYIDATHNPSSGLPNRAALESDIQEFQDPIVIVCALDGYETLAGFYESSVIRSMEEAFVKLLEQNFPKEKKDFAIYHPSDGLYCITFDNYKSKVSKDELYECIEKLYIRMTKEIILIDYLEFSPLITMGVSINASVPYENARTSLKEAYKQKKHFLFSDDVLENAHKEIGSNLHWIQKIRDAINDDRIVPFFQPLYNNKTKKIEKYESLIRLIDNNGDIISPFHFLEISKKARSYHQLTRIMIDKAIEVFENRTEEFTINLSGSDIENDEIREHIISTIKQKPHIAKRLVFELLEDETFDSFDTFEEFITTIKSFGVQIAIDDFGSGYSNFVRLMDFQPDILKIDGSLIKNITSDSFSLDIVTTIQNFATKTGLKTVAEFVSDESIHEVVDSLGMDYAQGYYFAPPLSIKELTEAK